MYGAAGYSATCIRRFKCGIVRGMVYGEVWCSVVRGTVWLGAVCEVRVCAVRV